MSKEHQDQSKLPSPQASVQKAQEEEEVKPVAGSTPRSSAVVSETETTIQADNHNQTVVENTNKLQGGAKNLEQNVAELKDTPSEDKKTKEEKLQDSLPKKKSILNFILGELASRFASSLPKLGPKLFSKWGFIGIILVIAVGVILTSGLLFPDETAEVAEIPAVEEIETSLETEIAEIPAAEIENQPEPEIPEIPATEIENQPEPEIPEIPIIKSEPVNNEPKPKLKLNPEQSLIAAIQEQVTKITSEYGDGLIISLQANFISSRLIIKASNDWYELDPERKQAVANEILGRSRKLDFKKLAITDPEGKLVARSPVVGQKVIVLQ